MIRRQPKTSASGGGAAAAWSVADPRLWTPQRGQGVVPAQPRQTAAGSGTRAIWRANRPSTSTSADGASTRVVEGLDMAAVVREWERGDELMWSLIISPEDAERMDLRQHAR